MPTPVERPPVEKICPGCKQPFITTSTIKQFCDRYCRARHESKSRPAVAQYPGLPTATTGAISELRVATDLLTKGYEVFRALSSSCSCDLAVLKGTKLVRVEVRTSYDQNGKIAKHKNPRDAGRQDVYAWVLPDRIIYEPEIIE